MSDEIERVARALLAAFEQQQDGQTVSLHTRYDDDGEPIEEGLGCVIIDGIWDLWEIARAVTAWQPIETAPKDGTVVLGLRAGTWRFPQPVAWERPNRDFDDGSHPGCKDAWVYADWLLHIEADPEGINPTHWMPLPAPPTT